MITNLLPLHLWQARFCSNQQAMQSRVNNSFNDLNYTARRVKGPACLCPGLLCRKQRGAVHVPGAGGPLGAKALRLLHTLSYQCGGPGGWCLGERHFGER